MASNVSERPLERPVPRTRSIGSAVCTRYPSGPGPKEPYMWSYISVGVESQYFPLVPVSSIVEDGYWLGPVSKLSAGA